jgi:hypothetical protein
MEDREPPHFQANALTYRATMIRGGRKAAVKCHSFISHYNKLFELVVRIIQPWPPRFTIRRSIAITAAEAFSLTTISYQKRQARSILWIAKRTNGITAKNTVMQWKS